MPREGRPDTSVNPGGQDFDLAASFNVLVESIDSLKQALSQQTDVMERTASAEARYSVASLHRLPQIREPVLQQIAYAGGMSASMTGGASQISPTGALSSLQNLQSFAAQRFGTWLAGTPLFSSPGGGQGGPGGTPVGTPNSTAAPAGSGAQAVAAAASGAGGGTAGTAGTAGPGTPGGIPGQGGALTGLPGRMWASGAPQGGPQAQGLGYMQLLGSRIAMSGGSFGGVMGALKGLPGIGLLADLYSKGTDFFQGQWAQGRQYQETEGGSMVAGQIERLRQLRYQAGMALTPMGATAAGEAFNTVTAMGYNPAANGQQQFGGTGAYAQTRHGALDFIYHNYTNTGMSVQESASILQTASQNATVQLGQVSAALKNLSDDAGKAGTNAQQARQEFNSYFQAALGAGAGPGAPALAGAVAATQASYGKQFAGVSFAGELSQSRQYLLSGQSGISVGQLQVMQRTNPLGYANLLAGQNLSYIQQYLGIPADAMQDLQNRVAQAGGGSAVKLNPDLADQIANQWLNQWQGQYNWNLSIWAQMLTSLTGIQLDAAHVGAWIVQQVAGNNEASNKVTGNPGTTGSAAAVSARNTAGAAKGQFGLAQPTNATAAPASKFGGTVPGKSWQQVLTSHAGTAASAYLSEEKKAGQRSPVLEALLQNLGQGSSVQVQTKNGPRVMSFTDAMKYYPDELMAGNVTFYDSSGRALGGTSAITHGLTSANAAGVSAEQRQAAGSNLGVSQAAWRRAHPGAYAQASNGQGVTVSLSKEAQQLLKLLPSNSDTASASATAPSPPWPSVSSR